MIKKIKVNQKIPIYSSHDENSKTESFLQEGDIVEFNREKRRDGIDWIEIILNRKNYFIKKDSSKFSLLKRVKLIDNACTIVFFESKAGEKYTFGEVFTVHSLEGMNQGCIKVKRIFDHAQQEKCINLYYDINKVNISKRIFAKGEEIIITNKIGVFTEVLYGKKTGYILSDIAYYEPKNWWMVAVVSVVGLFMMVGLIYGAISSGWVVKGAFLAIPVIIVSAIIIVFIKGILTIINLVVENIRKRL